MHQHSISIFLRLWYTQNANLSKFMQIVVESLILLRHTTSIAMSYSFLITKQEPTTNCSYFNILIKLQFNQSQRNKKQLHSQLLANSYLLILTITELSIIYAFAFLHHDLDLKLRLALHFSILNQSSFSYHRNDNAQKCLKSKLLLC